MIWFILLAAIGIGLLIFVHELGHFLVAKACGVKCEKFMIGFDIGGYKLSHRWGDTVYGIGILPLGGYVKMLGQEDNPANITEQLEQSRAEGEDVETVEVTGPGGEKYQVDHRSYLAKSVPQRMAIISAGVIMNVIFAVVFATIAFGLGVSETPSVISKTVPGGAAWQADLRTGDEILKIGDIEKPSFAQLTGKVTLGDLETGVPLVVKRGGSDEQLKMSLKPRKTNGRGLARIGIVSPSSLELNAELSAVPGSVAADVENGFRGGDRITAVDGEPIDNYRGLAAILATRPGEPLTFTVSRKPADQPADDESAASATTETITVPPNRMKRLGLVMEMGPVVAVQENSPAAAAGLEPGSPITSVATAAATYSNSDGDEPLDPITLPAQLQPLSQAGGEVTLSTGEASEAPKRMTLRAVDWLESMDAPGTPMSIPELGVAYEVVNNVVDVVAGSPAAEAGIQPGDRLIDARLLVPKPDSDKINEEKIGLGDELNWPSIVRMLQTLPAGTEVVLTYERNGEQHEAALLPTVDAQNELYVAERGLILSPLQRIRKAESFGEQLQYGLNSTGESLLMVYRFLQKLWEGQVPATALAGPVSIAKFAYYSASDGISTLLMFMTMFSANLAVVNFLPIPVLDGGHMVFLAYEGIFRRPPSERVVVVLHLAGFAFIVGLMSFLILLDTNIIPRNL